MMMNCNATGALKLDCFWALTAAPAMAFDSVTTDALLACHDHVFENADFAEFPQVALPVWPASVQDGVAKVYRTDPAIRTAGQCEIEDGIVTDYDRF